MCGGGEIYLQTDNSRSHINKNTLLVRLTGHGYICRGCKICFVVFRDLVTAFKADILPEVEKEPIVNLLTKGRRSKTGKTKTLATWSTREIRKLKNVSW